MLGIVLTPARDKLHVLYCNINHVFEYKKISERLLIDSDRLAMKREVGKWVDIEVINLNKENPKSPIRITSCKSHP